MAAAAAVMIAAGFTILRYILARFEGRGRWMLFSLMLVTFMTAYIWEPWMIVMVVMATCSGFLADILVPLPDSFPRHFRDIPSAWREFLDG